MINPHKFFGAVLLLSAAAALPALSAHERLTGFSFDYADTATSERPALLLSSRDSLGVLWSNGAIAPTSPSNGNQGMPKFFADSGYSSANADAALIGDSGVTSSLSGGNENPSGGISGDATASALNSLSVSAISAIPTASSFSANSAMLLASNDDGEDGEWWGPPPDGGDPPDPGGPTVPEPSHASLVILGMALAVMRRRK